MAEPWKRKKAAGRNGRRLVGSVALTVRSARAGAAVGTGADNSVREERRGGFACGRWYAQSRGSRKASAGVAGAARAREGAAAAHGRMRGPHRTCPRSTLASTAPPLASLPRSTWWLLALVMTVVWFGALDVRRLQHPDEGRYAEIAREMAVSGDWVTPRLNDLKYFEKPPLQYWLGAATFDAFGVDEWTARLPAALAGFLAVVVVGFTAARLAGRDAGVYRGARARGQRLARGARAPADARRGAVVLAGARAVRVPARAARGAAAVRAAQLDARSRTRRPPARR